MRFTSASLLVYLLVCPLFGTACDEKSLTGPSVVLDQQFTLAPGESATIQDASVGVQFLRVAGDSRCPADAFCIQGGDALVHIAVRDSGTAEYDLHTGDSSRASILHGRLRIALIGLQPYPFSTRTIQADEYRATLVVSQ